MKVNRKKLIISRKMTKASPLKVFCCQGDWQVKADWQSGSRHTGVDGRIGGACRLQKYWTDGWENGIKDVKRISELTACLNGRADILGGRWTQLLCNRTMKTTDGVMPASFMLLTYCWMLNLLMDAWWSDTWTNARWQNTAVHTELNSKM